MPTSSDSTSQILDDSKKLNGSGFKNFLAWFEAIAQICASRSQLSEPLRVIRNGFLPQEFLTFHPMLSTQSSVKLFVAFDYHASTAVFVNKQAEAVVTFRVPVYIE